LSGGQRDAISTYTSKRYTEIRGCMNQGAGCTEDTKKNIGDMNDAFENAPAFEGTVYRGMDFGSDTDMAAFVAKVQRDGGLSDKGFVSTTTKEKVAFGFTGISKKESAVLSIRSKKGVSIENLSNMKKEYEVVMRPGAKLKLIGVRKDRGRVFLDMEEQ